MKWITKCITCEEVEIKKKKPKRYSWNTKTQNQALLIKSVHNTNDELHEVKVEQI